MSRRRTAPPQRSTPGYDEVLAAYLDAGSERELAAAYDWGRVALGAGRSIHDILAMHHRAFAQWQGRLGAADRDREDGEAADAAARFLAECLAPYDMAWRGVHDAVLTLRRLNESLELETQRIARAVHDEAGQLAVVLQLSLAELARELPAEAAAALHPLHATLDQVERQLRRLSHELRPSMLDDLGWLPAIRWLAQGVSARGRTNVVVHADTDARLRTATEIALYRVVQEALTNIARHAQAREATITASASGTLLTVTVADDGVGFEATAAPAQSTERGLGLLGMRERLAAIGGALQIESRPGLGTRLVVTVPMEARHESAADTRR